MPWADTGARGAQRLRGYCGQQAYPPLRREVVKGTAGVPRRRRARVARLMDQPCLDLDLDQCVFG